MGPDGELEPLDEDSAGPRRSRRCARPRSRPSRSACCSRSCTPSTSGASARRVREALPDVHVSLSSEVLPEFREYERFSTTVADAYLGPKLAAYLERLAGGADEAGVPAPLVMQSSGGVVDVEAAADAGGRLRALRARRAASSAPRTSARASGYEDVLTFDMGGTSTDVAPVLGGEAQHDDGVGRRRRPDQAADGRRPHGQRRRRLDRLGRRRRRAARRPALGGRRPRPGRLRQGRRGADGDRRQPAARLPRRRRGAGRRADAARREAAEAALGALGERARPRRARDRARRRARRQRRDGAARCGSSRVERGLDPREFALVAFGGAGGLHACALAEELGIPTVLVPRAGGVLSALGLAMSDVRRDYVRAAARRRRRLDATAGGAFAATGGSRRARTWTSPSCAARADLRYRGQSFELTVDGRRPRRRSRSASPRRTSAATATAMEGEPVELVNAARGGDGGGRAPRARAEDGRAATRTARRAPRRNFDGELAARSPVLPPRRHGRGRRGRGPGDRRVRRGDLRRAARAGRARSTTPGRWCSSDGERLDPVTLSVLASALSRHRRGDGRGADPRRLLLEHQGAPRLLGRAVRRRRARWSPRPSTSRSTSARCPRRSRAVIEREPGPGDVFIAQRPATAAARTCPTSRSSRRWTSTARSSATRSRARTTPTSAACARARCRPTRATIYQEGIVHPAGAARREGDVRRGRARLLCQRAHARRPPRRPARADGGQPARRGRRLRRAGRAARPRRRRAGVRRGARLRRAAHARGAARGCPTAPTRPSARSRATASTDDDVPIARRGDDRRRRARDRLRRHRRRRWRATSTARSPSRARPATSRCGCCCPPTSRPTPAPTRALSIDAPGGLARQRAAARRRGRRQRRDLASAIADTVLRRARPRRSSLPGPGPGDDEQPDHRRRAAGPTTRRSAAARARAPRAPGRRACTSG